ncbi:MAG: hypothetical protein NTX50_22205 [Candidatus Sumerlaeota bacterium]|nr:hypothetical protein [Candidatus Sumerlaeota bacterium]
MALSPTSAPLSAPVSPPEPASPPALLSASLPASPLSLALAAPAAAQLRPAKYGKSNFAEMHINVQRTQLIMSFYRGVKLFRDSFGAKSSGMSFRRMDYLIETYFRTVKDSSHQLFHDSEKSHYYKMLQVTFDMSFGIIFHHLLKCKETLRLAERYDIERLGSLVDRLQRSSSQEVAGVSQLFNRLREGYERDLKSLDSDIKRAAEMLDDLEKMFTQIIAVYSDNYTIMRSLFTQHAFFLKLFPREGVDRIFQNMFRETGATDAYIGLAFDFMRSGHLAMAESALRRAVRCQTKTRDSQTPSQFSRYYRARRLLHIGGDPQTLPEAAERLKEVQRFEEAYRIEEMLT